MSKDRILAIAHDGHTCCDTLLGAGDDPLPGEAGEFFRPEFGFELIEVVGLAAERGFTDFG